MKRIKKNTGKRAPGRLEIDSYGADARICAIADDAEMRASVTGQLQIGELEDQLRDNHLALEPALSSLPTSAVDDDDVGIERIASMASNDSGLVFDAFRERARILKDLYPFRVGDNVLVRRPQPDARNYLALLAISWAHAVGLRRRPTVQRTFERVVLSALAARRLTVDELRVANGFGGKFETRLKAMAARLGMRPNPSAAVYDLAAKDEGADVLGVFDWGDRRQGQWWAIGQATCAGSDSWKRKLNEPEGANWSAWLSENHPPSTFLAVPHHVHQKVLHRLTQGQQGFVLDRLRLVLCRHEVSAEELDLIAVMHDAGGRA